MEKEAVALWCVNELRHKRESTHRESQDWAANAMGARVVELRAIDRATAAE